MGLMMPTRAHFIPRATPDPVDPKERNTAATCAHNTTAHNIRRHRGRRGGDGMINASWN